MSSEQVLFRTRPHPILLAGCVVLVLLFFNALQLIRPLVPAWLPYVSAGIALVVFLLDYFSTFYEATTEAVMKRQGFPWLREEILPLHQIQDLKLRAGILGRVLGFGTLDIESAGTEGKAVLEVLPTWAYRLLRPLRRNRQRR